jgi:hypothetical protein
LLQALYLRTIRHSAKIIAKFKGLSVDVPKLEALRMSADLPPSD